MPRPCRGPPRGRLVERHAEVDQGVDGRLGVASPVALELPGRPQQGGKVAATGAGLAAIGGGAVAAGGAGVAGGTAAIAAAAGVIGGAAAGAGAAAMGVGDS